MAAANVDYPLAIALEDFIPIVFTLLGGIQLSRWVGRRDANLERPALIGTLILSAGGACKATWKLIRSLDGPDIKWLSGALFPFLAVGFALLAWALIVHDYRETGSIEPGATNTPARIPLIVGGCALATAFVASAATGWSRAYVIPTLGLATLGSLSLVIVCVKAARRRKLALVAAAFIANFVGVLVLSRLSGIELQTIKLQWIEQSVNTFATGCFAWASYQLRKHGSPS